MADSNEEVGDQHEEFQSENETGDLIPRIRGANTLGEVRKKRKTMKRERVTQRKIPDSPEESDVNVDNQHDDDEFDDDDIESDNHNDDDGETENHNETDDSLSQSIEANISVGVKKKRKAPKAVEPGIVYMSRVPERMTVNFIRWYFERIGKTKRTHFVIDEKKSSRGAYSRSYREGWVEFRDKRVAKRAALLLNTAQIGGKKRSRWYDELWNVKYLRKFRWEHLREQIDYQHAMVSQRMRKEITKVKHDSNFYLENVEKKNNRARAKTRRFNRGEIEHTGDDLRFRLNETHEDIIKRQQMQGRRKDPEKCVSTNKRLLGMLFSGGVKQ